MLPAPPRGMQVLEELSKTRQVLTFDNALVGLSGMRLRGCRCPAGPRRISGAGTRHTWSRYLPPQLHPPPLHRPAPATAVDTQAAQRSLTLTVPWMAASTMGLIRAMNFTSKPDLLGWVLRGAGGVQAGRTSQGAREREAERHTSRQQEPGSAVGQRRC